MLTTEEAARIRDEALDAAIRAHNVAHYKAALDYDMAVAHLRRIRNEAETLAARDYRTASNAAWSAYADAAADEAGEIAAWQTQVRHEKETSQ